MTTSVATGKAVLWPVLGIGLLLAFWELGGWLISSNPETANFAGFAPAPTLRQLGRMAENGEIIRNVLPSLSRMIHGLAWSVAVGVPMGIAIGRNKIVRSLTHVPFQFLRMISPLAWMPIAVLSFHTWDNAIVFLIAAAARWPVTFSTANGLSKIDPDWFKVARNLGAGPAQMVRVIILPAIAQDVLTGIRLALGVAWIVLVPAEYLGVTSGLGYAINDARDTLEYDRLAATVLIIGAIGFTFDGVFLVLARRLSWVHRK